MNKEDKISLYCTYGEAVHSPTAERMGLQNTPNEDQLANMRYVATEIFDKVREHIAAPLTASSFFRSHELNAAIGGSSTISQHMKGEAIDMYKPGRHKEIFDYIRKNLTFDQLIWEYGDTNEPDWVHCSKVSYRPNRQMVLRCFRDKEGKITYVQFDLYAL